MEVRDLLFAMQVLTATRWVLTITSRCVHLNILLMGINLPVSVELKPLTIIYGCLMCRDMAALIRTYAAHFQNRWFESFYQIVIFQKSEELNPWIMSRLSAKGYVKFLTLHVEGGGSPPDYHPLSHPFPSHCWRIACVLTGAEETPSQRTVAKFCTPVDSFGLA